MIGLRITTTAGQAGARFRAFAWRVASVMRDEKFGAAVQSYYVRATHNHMKAMADVGDTPATRQSRGVTWPGFATWTVPKFGMQVPEGTRFRWRGYKKGQKHSRGVFSKAATKKGLAGFAGPLKMERVWKKRASGKRYSPSSKMMLDTGALRNSLTWVVRSNPSAYVLRLEAGQRLNYFATQHERRPIWFVHLPTDEPRLADLCERRMAQMVMEGGL